MENLRPKLERVREIAENGRNTQVPFCGDMGKMSHDAAIAMRDDMALIISMMNVIIGDLDEAKNTSED